MTKIIGPEITTESRGLIWKDSVESPGRHGSQHNKFTVGDVQDPGDSILQTQAHGYQSIDAAEYQTGDQHIQERSQHT